jgi:hypothetical protein
MEMYQRANAYPTEHGASAYLSKGLCLPDGTAMMNAGIAPNVNYGNPNANTNAHDRPALFRSRSSPYLGRMVAANGLNNGSNLSSGLRMAMHMEEVYENEDTAQSHPEYRHMPGMASLPFTAPLHPSNLNHYSTAHASNFASLNRSPYPGRYESPNLMNGYPVHANLPFNSSNPPFISNERETVGTRPKSHSLSGTIRMATSNSTGSSKPSSADFHGHSRSPFSQASHGNLNQVPNHTGRYSPSTFPHHPMATSEMYMNQSPFPSNTMPYGPSAAAMAVAPDGRRPRSASASSLWLKNAGMTSPPVLHHVHSRSHQYMMPRSETPMHLKEAYKHPMCPRASIVTLDQVTSSRFLPSLQAISCWVASRIHLLTLKHSGPFPAYLSVLGGDHVDFYFGFSPSPGNASGLPGPMNGGLNGPMPAGCKPNSDGGAPGNPLGLMAPSSLGAQGMLAHQHMNHNQTPQQHLSSVAFVLVEQVARNRSAIELHIPSCTKYVLLRSLHIDVHFQFMHGGIQC